MTVDRWIITSFWLVLVVYWAISAIRAKRSVGGGVWGKESGVRLLVIVLLLLALHIPALSQALKSAQTQVAGSTFLGIIGVVVCAFGMGFAIWARAHLGRNWGLPMSRKENPELVTTGPYAFVRHPIYSGIILAMLGSAMGGNVF